MNYASFFIPHIFHWRFFGARNCPTRTFVLKSPPWPGLFTREIHLMTVFLSYKYSAGDDQKLLQFESLIAKAACLGCCQYLHKDCKIYSCFLQWFATAVTYCIQVSKLMCREVNILLCLLYPFKQIAFLVVILPKLACTCRFQINKKKKKKVKLWKDSYAKYYGRLSRVTFSLH